MLFANYLSCSLLGDCCNSSSSATDELANALITQLDVVGDCCFCTLTDRMLQFPRLRSVM